MFNFFRLTRLHRRYSKISHYRSEKIISDNDALRLMTLAKAEAGIISYNRLLKKLVSKAKTEART